MNYEEKILSILVESYRKSKKDAGDNKTNRRTQIKPEKLYKKYNANDGDFEEISAINNMVKILEKRGFVTADSETFGTGLQCIYLMDNKILEIEKYLAEHYGYESKDSKLNALKKLVETYHNASATCNKECEVLKDKILKRQVPKNIDDLDDILKAVAFIENNKEELYIREVSMKVYGDSKYFEENMIVLVCGMLRKYNGDEIVENELTDEVLVKYHIFKEPQKLCIKGNAILRIKGKDLDISGFDSGIEFQALELHNIETVKLLSPIFMTVENRTSYLRYKSDDTVTFYLGGYANRHQRDFLRLICDCNPNVRYIHFGDIDAGGLWIHNHLCEITEKRFGLFCMSVNELKNPEYAECLHQLSENDVNKMQELRKLSDYKDVVDYMLEHNVKLEQEIVSLHLMGNV